MRTVVGYKRLTAGDLASQQDIGMRWNAWWEMTKGSNGSGQVDEGRRGEHDLSHGVLKSS